MSVVKIEDLSDSSISDNENIKKPIKKPIKKKEKLIKDTIFKEEEKEEKEFIPVIKPVKPKKQVIPKNPKPTRQIKTENELIYEHLIPDEIKIGYKSIIIRGLSLPAKDKQKILYNKLCNSTYINRYLNHYLLVDYFGTLNDHLKAGLAYTFHLIETMTTKEIEQI